MHFKKSLTATILVAGLLISNVPANTVLASEVGPEKNLEVIDNNMVSVHDPSVVENVTKKEGEANYYAFGSHMAVAKTDDLSKWTQVSAKENDENSSLFGVIEDGKVVPVSFEEAFLDNTYKGKVKDCFGNEKEFGTYNAKAWITARNNIAGVRGNMWAPDVIYNRAAKEYHMYLSLNGNEDNGFGAKDPQKMNSVIVLLTSKNIEGPYVYKAPIIFSGVSEGVEDLSYENTDMQLACGPLDELPERYNKADSGNWSNFFPHAIDPQVFYDAEGNLRMIYGSWSGGIYEIELDEETGLRDYTAWNITKLYNTYDDRDIETDEYFGKRIAGGYYVSGEGPYIEYINGKYYLFVSYGNFAADGNYQMRIFSSDNPDGPFVDSKGESAVYHDFIINFNATYGDCYGGSDVGAPGTTRGSRLMTSYKWKTMDVGEISQGHNSAITVGDRAFVVYHTRYNDKYNEYHSIRTHELYTIDGCLVAAPYQYDVKVKDKEKYNIEDITGQYDIIFNNYDTNIHYSGGVGGSMANNKVKECEIPDSVLLNEDGSITKEELEIGTWELEANGKYVNININASYEKPHIQGNYKAVLSEQNADGYLKTCISGINKDTGIGIWCSAEKINPYIEDDPKNDPPAKEDWLNTKAKVSDSEYVLNLAVKQKYELSEVKKESKDYAIAYSSSADKKIAKINSKGLIQAKKEGKSEIIIKKDGKEIKVKVNVYAPKFKYDNKKQKYYSMNAGEKMILPYESEKLKPEFYISEKQQKFATIDKNTGEITAIKKGNVKVTVIVGEGKLASKIVTKVKISD